MLPNCACWRARGVPSATLSTDFPYLRKAAEQVFHLMESKIRFSPWILLSAATDSHRLDVSAFPGPPLEGCHYSLGKLSCTQSGVIDFMPDVGRKISALGGLFSCEYSQLFRGAHPEFPVAPRPDTYGKH